MSEVFWQAKIWELLHNSPLKALCKNSEDRENSFWQNLEVMFSWHELGWNPEKSGNTVLKHIHLADQIVSASDRS